jgi:bacillithiol biosynthesis deacetylase BshB1
MNETLDILAIAAHPDDAELGCGGLLAKHAAAGQRVGILDLTEGQLGTRGSVEERRAEAAASARILGLSARHNLGMEDGHFLVDDAHRRLVIEQIRRFRPRILLINAPSDRHPDHGRGAQLALESWFYAGLRKIETTWQGAPQEPWRPEQVYHYIQFYDLTPSFAVDITGFEGVKMEAIKAFSSQFYDPTREEPETVLSSEGFLDQVLSRTAVWGQQIGVAHAEALVSPRMVGVSSLLDLL